MNIVFDIDDTITDETGFVMKYAPSYLTRRYKINPIIKNPYGYNLSEIFGLDDKHIENSFWNHYFILYLFQPLKSGVKQTINNLKEAGYNIYFVSKRGKKTKETDTFINKFIRTEMIPFLTWAQLTLNHINYNQIKIVQTDEEKIDFIRKLRPVFVFDDQLNILQKASKFTKAVCMETSHCPEQFSSEIIKVSSFYKVSDIVLNNRTLSRDKKNRAKNKYKYVKRKEYILTESFYKIIRFVSKNFLLIKYKPIVHGKELIPCDKRAVVFVGNHRNNLDPLIATLFIKRPVHWAALLRLFEAKENLFGRNDIWLYRKLSSCIIKWIGAFPIARPEDTNYRNINVLSLFKMEEYINHGSSIGFFPEGTINRNPEKQNVLPLASDVVFSIARRNEVWIQPFSIVWAPKGVNVLNKCIITFSNPIETCGMNTAEIREKWEYEVNRSIDKAKEIFYEINENKRPK